MVLSTDRSLDAERSTMANEAPYSVPKFQYNKNATRTPLMPFGMHRGERLTAIPADYVRWMVHVPGFFDDKPTLLNHLIRLGKTERGPSGLEAAPEGCGDYFGWFDGPTSSHEGSSDEEDDEENEAEGLSSPKPVPPSGRALLQCFAAAAGAAGHTGSEHVEDTQRTPRAQRSSEREDEGAPSPKRQRVEAGGSIPFQQPAAAGLGAAAVGSPDSPTCPKEQPS